MHDKEEMMGEILSRIADELNITDTSYRKAVARYRAVGEWVDKDLDYHVVVMPQGSMNLGTVIRPLSDKDDFDIDLVCLLEDGKGLSAERVKNLVGERLKASDVYKPKLDREGKRCWTLQFDEFHMDVLPCVPNGPDFVDPGATAIDLTDKDRSTGNYQFKASNPAAYRRWFIARAKPIPVVENKRVMARDAEIKPVPSNESVLKTPLQKAIQLLKRHRDVYFEKNSSHAPISVIITTLAAQACPHETNVFRALKVILSTMESYIELRGDDYWVENPVQRRENFAEKWNTDPVKREAFLRWRKIAYEDFVARAESLAGLDSFAEHFRRRLRPEPVNRAFNKIGTSTREMRQKGVLKLVGLKAGLSASATAIGKTVSAHTFYGN